MRKDIRVVSMDAEAIAVIKKKKIQHERMRQGNARIRDIYFGNSLINLEV